MALECLALLQQILGIAAPARAGGFGPLHHAVGVDQDRGAIADAGAVEPEAVSLGDVALRMEVSQQGIVDPAKAIGPCAVTELAVHGDTQDLGIAGIELAKQRVQARDFRASGGGEVEGVEDQEDLLTLEARELHLLIGVAVEREVGRGCAFLNDAHGKLGKDPKGGRSPCDQRADWHTCTEQSS